MSLPSITETKNATLLRIRIVILAAHYTATSSPFCISRPEAGGRHPQQNARPTAPDLFKGQVPRHPNTISYAILLIDPVLHITLTMLPGYCFCIHAGNLNFLILQLLHHGVPGVDGCHPQMYRQATAVACGRPPRHRPPARCPSFILDLYFMFTIVPKTDDAATIFYRITLHIPHDEAGAGP
jgi:hypothetical protein